MEATGKLAVRVYASHAQIPVEGATVVVTAPGEGGRRRLLSVRATDRSGMIPTLSIGTPEPGESTSPHQEGPAPFAVCDVWVEHPAYAMLQVEGVQIFPGVETRQDAELLPLPEHPTAGDMTTVVDVTPQPL